MGLGERGRTVGRGAKGSVEGPQRRRGKVQIGSTWLDLVQIGPKLSSTWNDKRFSCVSRMFGETIRQTPRSRDQARQHRYCRTVIDQDHLSQPRTMKKINLFSTMMIAAAALLPVTSLEAQTLETRALTLEAAKEIVAGAEATAAANGWNVAIAVTDAAGELILLHRRDGTQVGSIDIAIRKAETAARFRRPSAAFQEGLAAGNQWVLTLGVLALEGGLPITVDGQVIGAVGVSGVTPQQDTQIAQAGVSAFTP